ncbi:MAG: hypothetical protein ACR2PX_13795 [Endozoicomonas sp.]|uniref:hypothetical protein n=1 Tax=Endozoicomonas sp. TaxID=1892382 RepID=UPI003D9B0D7E
MRQGRAVTTVFFLWLASAVANAEECQTGILNISESHWLRQKTPDVIKQVVLWLHKRNSYICYRDELAHDFLSAAENTAQSGDKQELQRITDNLMSIIPTKDEKAQIASQVGEKRLNELVKNHPESFDPVATGKAWGLIPSFPEEDKPKESEN